jgi:hypothetical protein
MVIAESEKQSKRPLVLNAFDTWPKVEVTAGESIICKISADGQISTQKK